MASRANEAFSSTEWKRVMGRWWAEVLEEELDTTH
jgi:hypothetical protein